MNDPYSPHLVNVYPMDHPELTFEELKERGWTELMVKRYLGQECGRIPVNHYRNFSGKRVWHLDRVERAEANPEFEKHFLRNLGKRVHADEVWVDEILDRIREFQRVRRDLFPPLEASELDRSSLLRLVCCRGREIWVFGRHMGASAGMNRWWKLISS